MMENARIGWRSALFALVLVVAFALGTGGKLAQVQAQGAADGVMSPTDLQQVPPTTLFLADFASGLAPMVNDPLDGGADWHFTNTCAQALLAAGHTAPGVARWGVPANCNNYGAIGDTDNIATTVLDTTPCLSGSTNLDFNYLLQTQEPGSFDRGRILLSTNGGAPVTLVTSPTAPLIETATWRPVNFVVAGAPASVRFTFQGQTDDGIANDAAGFLIDDVKVSCLAPPIPSLLGGPASLRARPLLPITAFAGSVVVTPLGGGTITSDLGDITDAAGGTTIDAASGESTSPSSTSPLKVGAILQGPDPCETGAIDMAVGPVTNGGTGTQLTVQNNPNFPEIRIVNQPGVTVTKCNVTVTGTGASGSCSFSGGTVNVDAVLPDEASITIFYTLSLNGGVQVKANPAAPNNSFRVDACAIWDFNGNGTIDGTESACDATHAAAVRIDLFCNSTADPNRQLGSQVHLPILNFEGQDDVCESWIEVQVIGCDLSKAVLVTWGEPGFCPPQAAGPLKVECTGLLRPGSTWNLLGAQIPTGSKGGMLFKFSARQLYEMGIDLGFDDVVADLMCETLFFGIVGDADDYRRFKKAYNEGLDFAGVPLDIASGTGVLAVDVLRKCPGDVTPGVRVTSKYNGIAGSHLGSFDTVFGGYGYYVPLVYADKGGTAAGAAKFNSIMYIQNGGLECSSIEIWFKGQDDCLRAKICEVFTLAPGETYQWDATDCVGPDWQGSAWLRSTQPLGVAVDIIGRDVLMTYVGEPVEINYTYDPNGPRISDGDQVGFGPLIYSEYQGWDTGVQVQNMSAIVDAKVKVYFYDRSGDVITTLVDWICPRGSQTFFLPVVTGLPGNWVGYVRVESQEWVSPGNPAVKPPNIVGVVTLIKYSDAARTDTREAIAYNLLPEHKSFNWQLGSGAGNLETGIGLIAVPSLLKDLDGTGTTSELAIANLVPKPGKTDFAIFIFDQNGMLDYVCEVLNDREVEYIDLQTWGYVGPGFKGSAIISATFWEHDVFSPTGQFVRNLVGLGAVSVERSGTRLGEDIPGDEAAGDRGIPFAMSDLRSLMCLTPFTGLTAPLCPGQPGSKPVINCTIPRAFFHSTDTPVVLADAVITNDPIVVSVPSGCVTADVNVWLSMFHTIQMVDWVVNLTDPTNTTVQLFSQICGPGALSGYVRTILDDEATPRIGDVANGARCAPDDFRRYNIQNPTGNNTLTAFEGKNPNGTWTLKVTDQNVLIAGAPVGTPNIQNDAGTLYFWELEFDLR